MHCFSIQLILMLALAASVQGQTLISLADYFNLRPQHFPANAPQKEDGVLPPSTTKKDLYPAGVDAKKEIGDALKRAAHDHKRVLLVFGGNWCYDCHVLDLALHQGKARKIMKKSFILVHVDVGEFNKNLELVKEYQIPLDKGVPAVAVLAGDGQLLYNSPGGEFEAARRMTKKQLDVFLLRWKESNHSASDKK